MVGRPRSSLRAAPDLRTGADHPGVFQNYFGSSGLPYSIPDELKGGMNLGFMYLRSIRAGW